MRDNQYPVLGPNWTIKSSGEKFLLFNFRQGISEDRYSISARVFDILTQCDGSKSIASLNQQFGVDTAQYLEYLNSQDQMTVRFLEKPIDARTYVPRRPNGNFLGRVLWHITGQCNCDCRHCYMATRDWVDLPTDDLYGIVEQLKAMNVYAVSLTGGEPFCRPDLFEIVQRLDRAEIKVEGIFTNGTLLTKEILQRLEAIQEIPLFVSINGPRDVPHDSFMGIDGGYALTIRNLQQAVAMVAPGDGISHFYHLVKKLGIRRWRVSVPFMEGNWLDNHETLSLSLVQELDAYRQILEMWLADGRPMELELGHVFRYVNGQRVCNNYQTGDYVCDYFRERMVIMPNGEGTSCSLLVNPPYILGNLTRQALEEIWESPAMRQCKDLRVRDVMKPKCQECQFLGRCGLGCRANAVLDGLSYSDIDEYTCHLYTEGKHDMIDKFLNQAGLGWREVANNDQPD